MNKRQAGRKGGRYYLAPIGQTQYALVERATNQIKSIREAR